MCAEIFPTEGTHIHPDVFKFIPTLDLEERTTVAPTSLHRVQPDQDVDDRVTSRCLRTVFT